MKKSLRCICAAIFALAFCTGFVIHASAVERASSYLTRYSATLFAGDRGAVEITISVVANQRVSELGASYILLEESDDGGRTWSTAKEYEGESWMLQLQQDPFVSGNHRTSIPGNGGCLCQRRQRHRQPYHSHLLRGYGKKINSSITNYIFSIL